MSDDDRTAAIKLNMQGSVSEYRWPTVDSLVKNEVSAEELSCIIGGWGLLDELKTTDSFSLDKPYLLISKEEEIKPYRKIKNSGISGVHDSNKQLIIGSGLGRLNSSLVSALIASIACTSLAEVGGTHLDIKHTESTRLDRPLTKRATKKNNKRRY